MFSYIDFVGVSNRCIVALCIISVYSAGYSRSGYVYGEHGIPLTESNLKCVAGPHVIRYLSYSRERPQGHRRERWNVYGCDLPFTSANSAVRIFRHALSLDEVTQRSASLRPCSQHRARFQPNSRTHFHTKVPPTSLGIGCWDSGLSIGLQLRRL